MSGLGKGTLSASVARLLKSRGYSVLPIKFDGYLNVDCGTMNPFRHGEVFVLDDGTEVDLDFGTYERFLNQSFPGKCSITGGKIFKLVIEKERRGEYLGTDVQFIPHLTNEIQQWIHDIGKDYDFVLIEVGGTAGDLENGYFLEAMRQLSLKYPTLFIQLTYIPILPNGEQKTKPTQHAVKLLATYGLRPNIIVCRVPDRLYPEARKKIALYSNLPERNIIEDPYFSTVYELPLVLEKQHFFDLIAQHFGIEPAAADLEQWRQLVENIKHPDSTVKVSIVGKYVRNPDAYISVKEALVHAGAHTRIKPEIEWIEAEVLEKTDPADILDGTQSIIVPGGFGNRGIEGKIKAIQYARENKIPYIGLCLGMQLMVVEYARNALGMTGAHSTEFDPNTPYPVIDLLPEQRRITEKGGTMRLGAYEARLLPGTRVRSLYGREIVSERHRHRYEVNPDWVDKVFVDNLRVGGVSTRGDVVEFAEWKDHFGIASQAHLELKSRLESPSPVFVAFLKEAQKR